jgi:hypothetical protein
MEVDLFGDPVLRRRDGRGRPEHLWTRENSNKVLLAFARGLSAKDAAMSIGVSVPTLRKIYFSEVEKRRDARLRLEITQLARLNGLAEKGSVPAEKELMKQMDRLRQRDLAQALASAAPASAKGKPLGKKESALRAAEAVRGLYEPPPPPVRIN